MTLDITGLAGDIIGRINKTCVYEKSMKTPYHISDTLHDCSHKHTHLPPPSLYARTNLISRIHAQTGLSTTDDDAEPKSGAILGKKEEPQIYRTLYLGLIIY